MKRIARRTALVALVWLTAASTVLAGLPRLECVCPGGRRGSPNVGAVAKTGGCCCEQSCCAAGEANPQPGEHSCCVQPQGEKPHGSAQDSGGRRGNQRDSAKPANLHPAQLHRPACANVPVQSEAQTYAPASPSLAKIAALDLGVALFVSPGPELLAAAPLAERSWLAHSVSPPTDRVIVLQHFLI